MRILVLTDLFPPVAFGGYELECAALVERLRASHDVRVLTTSLDRDSAPAEEHVLRELPFTRGDRLRAVAATPAAALAAARTTRRVLDEFRPELVFVSNGVALPQTAILIAAREGVPVVIRFSELFFAGDFLRGDRFLRDLDGAAGGVRRALGLVNRAVNAHPALRLDVHEPFEASLSWASAAMRSLAGVPPMVRPLRDEVIYSASPRNGFYAQVERAPEDPPIVLYVGRVTESKGAEVAVRTLAALRAAHGVDARLQFAGPCKPDMATRLDAVASQLGVAAHVERLGMLAPEELADALGRAAVMLMPSVAPEAFPLVLLEAASARVPVVASDAGGVPEALSDEEHALLVAPGDPDAAAAALARTLADPAATAARVERAFARAQTFSVGAYLDRSEELIADAAR